jgi:transposase InsO family protein
MSRSGNVWDNAAMESFFSSLKTERIARKIYKDRVPPRGVAGGIGRRASGIAGLISAPRLAG